MTSRPAHSTTDIDAFLATTDRPILDVRSPVEFARGHIPGAVNLPLFSDDERASVGIAYADSGRAAAIQHGLACVGPRLDQLVERARDIAGPRRAVRLHCWRGGMRSGSVAWLLDLADLDVTLLRGGYKAFRRWALEEAIGRTWRVVVVGGLSGSGKTELLHGLRAAGEQILDLEAEAEHPGSVFGGIDRQTQPSQQLFENRIAMQLAAFDPSRPVWVEDESHRIGRCEIPDGFWMQMQSSRELLIVEVPNEERVDRVVTDYGHGTVERLVDCLTPIEKRLGDIRYHQARTAIEAGDYAAAATVLLEYYDRKYRRWLEQRGAVHRVELGGQDPTQRVRALQAAVDVTAGPT